MSKLTIKEIVDKKAYHGLTMGELRDFVTKHTELSSDTKVLLEHVEDRYFEYGGWDFTEIEFEPQDTSLFYQGWSITKDTKEDLVYICSHY